MSRSGALVQAAAIVVLTVATYLPAIGGGYLWDDRLYVADNFALRSLAGLLDIWSIPPTTPQYYPLTFTTFWLEFRIFGDAPFGYHATNIALHALDALLLWRVLVALEVPGAFLAALVFAVHPLNVESVAWIAERKNVLSGLFALLAVVAWLRFLAARRPLFLALTTFLFACAVLSKSQVCTLPVVLLAIAWWKHPASWRRAVPWAAALGALGAAGALTTLLSERTRVAPELPIPQLDGVDRLLVAARSVWFYVGKLAAPVNLSAVYGPWPIARDALLPWAALLALLALAAVLWAARESLGRGPLVALVSFLALLGPALGLVDFNFMRFSLVADRFQYLAGIPLIALAAAGATRAAHHLAKRFPPAIWIARAAAAGVVLVLALTSRPRVLVHRDEEALWRDAIAHAPGSAAAHNHLGSVLQARGQLDQAIAEFAAATRINPGYADALNNWATVLKDRGQLDQAIARYGEAVRADPADPVVHSNLGVALALTGDPDAAVRHFAEATRLDPRYAAPEDNWGVVLLARDNSGDAIEHFARAAALAPGSYDVLLHYGDALQQNGQDEAAISRYRQAIVLDATRIEAHRALAPALFAAGRTEEAIGELSLVVELAPQSAEAHHELGVALGKAGRLEASLSHLETAARLAPNDADVQNHLGVALALAGRLDEAVPHLQEAARLRPDAEEPRANLASVLARRKAPPAPAP